MQERRFAPLAGLLACLILGGCLPLLPQGPLQRIPDNQLTYDDFNDTTDFAAGYDAAEAFPPVPVHEFDAAAVTQAGGKKVIDGRVWLAADDETRNDMLVEIEDATPPGATLVIEVASGTVWEIPLQAAGVILDGTVTAWSEDEYDDLPDFVADTAGFGFYGPNQPVYLQLTAIAMGAQPLRPLAYVHPLTRGAVADLAAANGFGLAPVQDWQFMTPLQRYRFLLNLQNYLLMTALYQSGVNPFMFAVSVPDGGIYAFREMALWQLAATYAVYPWTAQQIALLSTTGALPFAILQRRGEILRRALRVDEP